MNNTVRHKAEALNYSEDMKLYFRKNFIRKRSNAVGFTVVVAFGLQYALIFLISLILRLLTLLGAESLYDINVINFINEMVVVTTLTVPSAVCAIIVNGSVPKTVLSEKVNPLVFIGSTLVAFGVNALSNYGNAVFKNVLSLFGTEAVAITNSGYSGTEKLAITLLCSAVFPALIEEFAYRGVVLGIFRRSMSDMSAIIMSAVVFAVIHGNLAQIPFAFGMGLAFALVTVSTKSIWPAIVAHFLNNACSVILSSGLVANLPGNSSAVLSYMFYVISSAALVFGLLLLYFKNRKIFSLSDCNTDLTVWQTVKASILSPGIILVFVAYGIQIFLLQTGVL